MTGKPVYQRDADMAPDSEFEPGEPAHLVPGNRGRLLDPRRTPVSVVEVLPEPAMFTVRIEGFEDRGATWTSPVEEVKHFQFARGCPRLEAEEVRALTATAERLDRPLQVVAEAGALEDTLPRLEARTKDVRSWLEGDSEFFGEGGALPDPATRTGDPRLWRDLQAHWGDPRMRAMEEAFARQFVSNPHSGEMIKGHRIVLAELGLCTFEGKQPRMADLFDPPWTKESRAEHILGRMAFVRAVFGRLGRDTVTLYRGISNPDGLKAPRNRTFVSATFDKAVAQAHFDAESGEAGRRLLRREIPVERVFMTFYETEAMNLVFKEAEAVLLFDPASPGL